MYHLDYNVNWELVIIIFYVDQSYEWNNALELQMSGSNPHSGLNFSGHNKKHDKLQGSLN